MRPSNEIEQEMARLIARGRRIEAQWTSFREVCIADVPEWMFDPLRSVFFAGATAALNIVFDQTSDADEATEEDRRLINDLQEEVETFRLEAALRAAPAGTEH
jgi:hypothetical protein